MSLLDTLRKDMFSATKLGEVDKAEILKLAMASIKNAQIESEEELKDEDMLKILRKEERKIQDSIAQFASIGRDDLVKKETTQLEAIEQYLPKQMSREEVEKIVIETVDELKPEGMKDMGKVMGVVMKKIAGKADGNTVKEIVLQQLQ